MTGSGAPTAGRRAAGVGRSHATLNPTAPGPAASPAHGARPGPGAPPAGRRAAGFGRSHATLNPTAPAPAASQPFAVTNPIRSGASPGAPPARRATLRP